MRSADYQFEPTNSEGLFWVIYVHSAFLFRKRRGRYYILSDTTSGGKFPNRSNLGTSEGMGQILGSWKCVDAELSYDAYRMLHSFGMLDAQARKELNYYTKALATDEAKP